MLRVQISTEDIPTIRHDRFYHPQPHIMMRMHTLALHQKGESAARIAELLNRAGVPAKCEEVAFA